MGRSSDKLPTNRTPKRADQKSDIREALPHIRIHTERNQYIRRFELFEIGNDFNIKFLNELGQIEEFLDIF